MKNLIKNMGILHANVMDRMFFDISKEKGRKKTLKLFSRQWNPDLINC